jgi:predicted metalloprotease with PDZ domain
MPTLDERQVFFPGALVLLAPPATRAVQGPIPVEWQVPPGWQVLSPFGPEARDLPTLLDNYLAAGKFSRVTREVPGGLQLDIAWFGEGDVASSLLPGMISRVFGAAVELMGGRAPTARYVILLRSDFPPGQAQGSPREGSIQVHLPRNVPLERILEFGAPNPPVLLGTLAHEYLHTWGRDRAEGLEESDAPEPGGELRWFEEGFVHYLAYLSLLRSGVVDLHAFQSTIMGRAYASVLKNPRYGQVSLVQASERFFEDPESRQLAYSGGMVVAFLCDMELRARGLGSLERFLDELPPGRHVEGWARWSEAWAKKTGSPEPVASWVRGTAPLPFHEYWERSERWIPDLVHGSQGP